MPPIKAGDVIRSVLDGAQAIVIIDGLYESVASVRHKEILLALSRGVRVVGAASMGALRAAELDVFGMEGVGRIYEWYRSGFLEDDDEVAIRHATADGDFRPITEALVNIRGAVEYASRQSLISEEAGRRVLEYAKALYYAERSWPALRSFAAKIGVPSSAIDTLADVASSHNLKRD